MARQGHMSAWQCAAGGAVRSGQTIGLAAFSNRFQTGRENPAR